MTEKLIRNENEAIDVLKKNKPTSGFYMLQESVDMAIQALSEIQQYKAIGTIDEFKALKHFESNYEHNLNVERNKAIDDVICKIADYKEKHYHNRAEYPINYGLLCDMENWFYDMKGE